MSTMQRLTLIGLKNYYDTFEQDLFSKLTLPAGYDKATFINTLLMEHGEKCVLYTNPEFFRECIGIWSAKWSHELTRIHEALTAEYNPIWNYDRNERWSDTGGRKATSQSDTGTKSASETEAGHTSKDTPKYDDDVTNDYDVVTEQNTDATTENKISADNSSDYQPERKEISNNGKTTVANDGTIKRHIEGTTQDLTEESNSKTQDRTATNSKTEDQEETNGNHTGHLWGNIGVTTSAAMVREETELRFEYNLYDIATRLFANELLLGIY